MLKKYILFLLTLASFVTINAQVNFTANDVVVPYDGLFRPGVNPGYEPPWTDFGISDLAESANVRVLRTSLPDNITSFYGLPLWDPIYDYYQANGQEELTVILGDPREDWRDYTDFCTTDTYVDENGVTQPLPGSNLFEGLHLPIWDGGANGTPYNDDNKMAAYTWELANRFGDHITFYEIWNEPGLDFAGVGWRPPGDPFGNWWDNDPEPCQYKLKAPIEYFVRTLRVAYDVIKTVDPDAYVVLAGVGYESFLDAILRNTDNPVDGSVTPEYPYGGGAYFDVMGFHAYPHFDGSTGYREPPTYELVFERHSDGAANGLLKKQALRQEVLSNYGYDGTTYPAKEWICTELNLPSESGYFHPDGWEYLGGEVAQRNYMSKALVTAAKMGLTQVHVWKLAERELSSQADDEFDNMGLFEKIEGTAEYSQTVITQSGISYSTTSEMIFGSEYDAARTAQMNMPAGVDGAAFVNPNGDYTYAIWAVTTIDQSESASATYSFPASFGLGSMTKYNWDYILNNQTSTTASTGIQLDATPIFLRGSDVVVPFISINCPSDITMTAPAGATSMNVNIPNATASTTCANGAASVTTISILGSGSPFPIGTSQVTFQATNNCGNIETCNVNVTVNSGGNEPTCNDGIQNQGETGVDCGGPCAPCPTVPTCNDGIQNQGETGVDCGGPCAPCSSECNISVTTSNGNVIITGLTGNENAKLFTASFDAAWECNPWNGSPCTGNEVVTDLTAGTTYFFSVETAACGSLWIPVTPGGSTASCNDGIQNQGETGIDCGGPCAPCPSVPTCNDGIQNQGETGVDCGGPCAPCSGGGCNVAITSANGSVTITGLTADANTKLFDVGVDEVWGCNPWTGSPCSVTETVSGLTVGAIYFLSVQSPDCDEWISIVIQGGGTTATCNDGIQNQGETGIDCGGPCAPCPTVPTCNDGIQNQGETGVDCGGPCAPCSGGGCNVAITSANGGVTITGLTSDANTKLFDANVDEVWGCNPWTGSPCGSTETVSGLVSGATYFLSVQSTDCDEWIPVTINGSGATASCIDGIQNQGETGVDCGGPCAPCQTGNTPIPTLTASVSQVQANQSFQVFINYNEPVTDLTLAEVQVTNGIKSNPAGSGASYSFTVTANNAGPVSVYIPANVSYNGNGVGNIQSNTLIVNANMPENTTQAFLGTPESDVVKITDVFPNPASDEVNLKIMSNLNKRIVLEVYDLNGRAVRSIPMEMESGLNVITLPINDLKGGMYMINIQGNNMKTSQTRFVKQRL